MILKYDGTNYYIVDQEYNYETVISLALDPIITADNTIRWYDQDTSNDYRISSLSFKLNAEQTGILNTLLASESLARGNNISIFVSNKKDNFLFGADLGNYGIFEVSVVDYKISPYLQSPFRYFDVSLRIKMVTNPIYNMPSEVPQGNLRIGSTLNLLDAVVSLETNRAYTTSLSNSGDVYRVNKLEPNDYQIADITIECNQTKAGRIIYDLSNNIRGGSFNIIAQANNYFFGIDEGGAGTYSVKLNSNMISISHIKYNKFIIKFQVRNII